MALPDWKLPAGVSRALWEYAQQPHIATLYDQSIAQSGLADFDQRLLAAQFERPGRLADLGCGTGRHALAFAARGFEVWGVDLSRDMLRQLRAKAEAAAVTLQPLQANLCELECLSDDAFDYAILMFSTLGMIAGEEHRLTALRHAHRILKPGGRFAVHVHNVWFNAFDPHGRRWLVRDRWRRLWGDPSAGDKVAHDRGIPNMRMHVFARGEITALLRRAGFEVESVHPLASTGGAPLARPLRCGWLRANGWILFARKT